MEPFQQLGITANNFMFYHENLEAAEQFYAEVIGLKKVLDYGTAIMFQIASTSYITLVRANDEKHNLAGPRPVTVSFITDELRAWHSYLSTRGFELEYEQMRDLNAGQHSFVIKDPAGYYLQFIKLNKRPQTSRFSKLLAGLSAFPVKPLAYSDSSPLSIKASISSFYYSDLESARDFYQRDLGFNPVLEQAWAQTFHTSLSGFFRIVNGTDGLHKPSTDISQRKGVMLSLFTNKVDAWFSEIKKHDSVTLRTPDMVDIPNIREFSFNDPGDYAVELNFFKNTKDNLQLLESFNR